MSALEGWRPVIERRAVQPRLRAELKDQGLTLKVFAELAEVPYNSASSWCRARRVPKGETMLRAAQVLDCEVEHLWRIGEAS